MEVNLFGHIMRPDLKKKYDSLSSEYQLTLDVGCLIRLARSRSTLPFKISREIIFDENTHRYKAKYIIEVQLN